MTDSTGEKCFQAFNYCFWAKLVVAIPALPAVAMLATMPFEDLSMKIAAAIAAVALTIYGAIKIDQIPALTKKIVNKK